MTIEKPTPAAQDHAENAYVFERHVKEAQGTVRWLRPAFQDPALRQAANQTAMPMPEQMRAVADALAQYPAGLSEDQLAERFTGRGQWRKRLPQILDTLVALGRARSGSEQAAGGGGYWMQG